MLDRVVLPLIETALGLTGRVVKPVLNLWCDCLEAIAKAVPVMSEHCLYRFPVQIVPGT